MPALSAICQPTSRKGAKTAKEAAKKLGDFFAVFAPLRENNYRGGTTRPVPVA